MIRKPTRSMPAKHTPGTVKKVKSLEAEYLGIFVPAPLPQWQRDDENYSLEQPSPLKWVPSETTYGVGSLQPVLPNA